MKEKVINIILKFFKFLIKMIIIGFNSVKFILQIPLTSLIATIFSIGLIFIYRTLHIILDIIFESIFNLTLSTASYYVFVESILGAIIYIVLNYLIFKDKLKNDPYFSMGQNLLYYLPTIIIWIIPILIFKGIGDDALSYLVYGLASYKPIYNFIFIIFCGPHLWLGVITMNAGAIAIGLAINNFIYIICSFLKIRRSK